MEWYTKCLYIHSIIGTKRSQSMGHTYCKGSISYISINQSVTVNDILLLLYDNMNE
jgi:hypothetical protein